MLPELALLPVIALIAAILQGAAGFGQALIAIPMFALVMDIRIAVPLSLLNGLLINVTMMTKLHERLDFGKSGPLIMSALFGIPIGVYFLASWDPALIKKSIGLIVALYSALSLTVLRNPPYIAQKLGWVFGFFSGIVGGAFGMNGPVSVVYVTSQKWELNAKKAALATYFVASNILILILYMFTNKLINEAAANFAVCAPFVLAGTLAGHSLAGRIGGGIMRKVILALILTMGVSLLV